MDTQYSWTKRFGTDIAEQAVEKVEDIMKIMEYNVISTPELFIDSKVILTGKTLSVDEVITLIEEAKNE